jgi:toxin ParE1/3/4
MSTERGKRVRWSERAAADLERILAHIAVDRPLAAERWVSKLVVAAERAAERPFACRRVPEFSRDDLREAIVKHYRIVLLVRDDRVEILTVFEGHRLLVLDE